MYKNAWRAQDLVQLEKKIRFCIKNMDQNLVQDLLASTATRLNDIRMDLLKKDKNKYIN